MPTGIIPACGESTRPGHHRPSGLGIIPRSQGEYLEHTPVAESSPLRESTISIMKMHYTKANHPACGESTSPTAKYTRSL